MIELFLHEDFYTVHLLSCFLLTKITLTWMTFTWVPPLVWWMGVLKWVFWKIIFDISVQTELSHLVTIWKTLFLPFPRAQSFPRGRTVTSIVHANPYQKSSNQPLTLNKCVLFFTVQSLAVTWMSFEDCYYIFLLHLQFVLPVAIFMWNMN